MRQRLSSPSARRETRGNVKARESNIQQKASFEPSKLTDKNAIKCEIFDQADWLVIGHCGMEKIPKLTNALKICYVKGMWITLLFVLIRDPNYL